MRIGSISDTHGYLDPKVEKYFATCDEIWHIGDVGNIDIVKQLTKIKPVRGVYGNIDGQDIRKVFPKERGVLSVKLICPPLSEMKKMYVLSSIPRLVIFANSWPIPSSVSSVIAR